MNHSWMSPIMRRLNSVEKMQVFCPWSSLRMSACTVPRTFFIAHSRNWTCSCSSGSRPCSASNAATRWSIAVLRKNARIVGAGPLIVIETEVVGEVRSKPS